MNVRKPLLIAFLTLLLAGPSLFATTVGLSSNSVNGIYAEQKQSEWCWAACIQMISNLYGTDLTQDEVVARTYGPGVNRAGTLDLITANLNGNGTTRHGRTYTMSSRMITDESLPAALVAELSAGHPVMLGCDEGGSGHAVVCTAVSYDGDAGDPTITALTVRDPWPSASNRAGSGRQVLRGSDLGPRIVEGWIVHITVHEADGSDVPAPQGYVFNDTDASPNNAPAVAPDPFPSPRAHRPLVATNNSRPSERRATQPNDHPLAETAVELVDLMQTLLKGQ